MEHRSQGHRGVRSGEFSQHLQNRGNALYSGLAASFVITPLVPGSPSLDVKPHSPGETRHFERKKSEFRRTKCRYSHFLIHNSCSLISPCQFVTVVLKCRRLSAKTRAQPQTP